MAALAHREVAQRHDADEAPLRIDDGQAADLVLAPKLRAARTAGAGGVRTALRGRGWGVAGALAISGYTVLAVGLPTLALVAASVTRAVGLPPTPSNWTSANFRTALNAPTIDAIGNSIWLAGCAAFALTALGALVAALERRSRGVRKSVFFGHDFFEPALERIVRSRTQRAAQASMRLGGRHRRVVAFQHAGDLVESDLQHRAYVSTGRRAYAGHAGMRRGRNRWFDRWGVGPHNRSA